MGEMNMLDQAYQLAAKAHAGQSDKLGVPYIAHVKDVAARVAHLGEVYEIVGLLHDAVEDSELTLDEVEHHFGPNIRAGVAGMTKNEGEDYFTDYLPRVATNDLARAVKIADSSHNLSKAHLISDLKLRTRLEKKYERVLKYFGVQVDELEPIVFDQINGAWISKP